MTAGSCLNIYTERMYICPIWLYILVCACVRCVFIPRSCRYMHSCMHARSIGISIISPASWVDSILQQPLLSPSSPRWLLFAGEWNSRPFAFRPPLSSTVNVVCVALDIITLSSSLLSTPDSQSNGSIGTRCPSHPYVWRSEDPMPMVYIFLQLYYRALLWTKKKK